MKSILYREYGSPDVLRCEDVEVPTPGDDEVLIRIRAAAANPMDYYFMRGAYIMRPFTGLRRPKLTRPGADLAGEVVAVGTHVTRFKPGDAVFGAARGAFAEYACALESRLALKPTNLSFEQASAIPVAGLTALQGLRDKARVQPGQKVLINGASGGVGSFAVQIAKSLGAEVTGVCRSTNVGLVRSLGADHVIDYTREDFTLSAVRFDVVFDTVGNHSLSACRRVMTPKGTILPVGGGAGGMWVGPLPHLLKLVVSSRFVSQRVVFFVASVRANDLIVLKELCEAGKVTPAIDRCYPMGEVVAAIRHLKEGHPHGKVVITVAP
jgi:NADPH:quinone reductase-like Zn-dependent oxidoreductase